MAETRCPNCDSADTFDDGVFVAERYWQCRKCGYEWEMNEPRDDASPPTAGEAE